jgi:hypothetical protein
VSNSANSHRDYVDGILLREALYTVEGVMRATGIGEETLREWRRKGKLKGYKVGARIRYLGGELIDVILREAQTV